MNAVSQVDGEQRFGASLRWAAWLGDLQKETIVPVITSVTRESYLPFQPLFMKLVN